MTGRATGRLKSEQETSRRNGTDKGEGPYEKKGMDVPREGGQNLRDKVTVEQVVVRWFVGSLGKDTR